MPRKCKDVNVYRIANETNLSIATVSRVMNNRIGVSEESRQKVKSVLEKYNFASNYPVSTPHNIGVVIPYSQMDATLGHYMNRVIAGVSRYGEEYNINPFFMFYRQDESQSLLSKLRNQETAAALILFSEMVENQMQELLDSSLPIVAIDGLRGISNLNYIGNDPLQGIVEAMNYLFSMGHRRIGFMQAWSDRYDHQERQKIYETAMRKNNETPLVYDLGKWCPESVIRSGVLTMLRHEPELTAIITVSDDIAIRLLRVCHLLGIKLPGDLSIVGFDNNNVDADCYPSLTSIHHPVEEISYQAMKRADILVHRGYGWSTPVQTQIASKLIIRESTGKPRKSSVFSEYSEKEEIFDPPVDK